MARYNSTAVKLLFSTILIFSLIPVGATESPETSVVCEHIKKWKDKGSGADLDGRFSIPKVGNNYFTIGGFGVQRKKLRKSDCVTVIRATTQTLPHETVSIGGQNHEIDGRPMFTAPTNWELIWGDEGSGAKQDGSMWRPISADEEYECVGSVPQRGYRPPVVPNYRCVHRSLLKKVTTSGLIWNDKGSGAKKQVSMFLLPSSRSFVAVEGRPREIDTYDLDLRKFASAAMSVSANDAEPYNASPTYDARTSAHESTRTGNHNSGSYSKSGEGKKEAGGALLGALTGGAIGLLTGDVTGAVIGAVTGAALGGFIGATLDAGDERKRQQAMYALSTMKAGRAVTWDSPERNTTGTITATSDKFNRDGLSCMVFHETVSIGGQNHEVDEVRCLQGEMWVAQK